LAVPGRIANLRIQLLVVVLASLNIPGCLVVPVPFPVEAETTVVEGAKVTGYLSVGPRRLIEDIALRIETFDDRIEAVDPIVFRDMAFPDGGWSIAELLKDDTCTFLRKSSGVRFLVLLVVGPPQRDREEKTISLGLGATGYATEKSQLSAVLVDFDNGKIVCQIDSTATGRELFFVTWAGGYATNAITEPSVKSALAQAIATRLLYDAGESVVKVAVLAAEQPVGIDVSERPPIP
jgi:hypothetical protein